MPFTYEITNTKTVISNAVKSVVTWALSYNTSRVRESDREGAGQGRRKKRRERGKEPGERWQREGRMCCQ